MGERSITVTDHPAVARFLDIAAVAAAPKQGWTDVATIAAHGLVAVNYGPGDPAQAHSAGEWVDIEDLHRCERTLARVVARWGGLT
jgi:succinyl-diaminopimelate desuccinylase